jgi:hypothetical protein
MPGGGTSKVELTNVSGHGLWLMIDDEELALPFDQFPWFRDATIAQLSVRSPLAVATRCSYSQA